MLVLNCVLPQLDSLVVGDSLRHDCCSSDASSDANEENFDSDASLDANEESFDVDRLFDGVLHFDMADDDFDEFEFEEMSPIRNVTDLETVYNRNWSTADWGDSRDVEASLGRPLCQASEGLCETGCMSWGDVSREEKGHVMYPSIEQAGNELCENLKPCHMLLNSVGLPSSDMWLLDSGASVSVVSRDFLKGFQHSAIKTLVNPLQAANGTSVNVDGFCKMLLEIQVVDGKRGNQTPKPAVLPVDVVVGDTAYPILSVCKLGKQGWDFSCGKTVSMIHRDTKSVAHGHSVWYDTPRFHAAAFLYPSFGSMGVVVMARIRVGTEMIARTFIAKSIKLCLPIAISNDFGIFVQLVHERSGIPVEPVVDKPPESVLPEYLP